MNSRPTKPARGAEMKTGGDSLPLMQAGNIKAYATTSDARAAIAPDIPTFAELGLPTLTIVSRKRVR